MQGKYISDRLLLASKYMPLGTAPVGAALSGFASLFSNSWVPLILFFLPWSAWTLVHYVNRRCFLDRASWTLQMNIFGVSLAFMYPSALNTIAAAFEFYGLITGSAITVAMGLGFLLYGRHYYLQYMQAWEEKRNVNLRFALRPRDNTYRVREGFNYSNVESLGWDDQVLGVLLSISTTGAAFLGGIIYEDTLEVPLAVMAVLGAILCLIFIRMVISKELVALAKIREYEQEHGVTIRPR